MPFYIAKKAHIMANAKRQKQTASVGKKGEQARPLSREGSNRGTGAAIIKTNTANTTKARKRVTSNRSSLPLLLGILAVLVVIVGVFIFFYNQSNTTTASVATPADATTFKQVTQVDPDLLTQTGTGGVKNPFKVPKDSPAPLLGPTGKPEVFYVGAEFCPYCAVQRWGVIVAVSRFGTFSKLTQTISADAPEAYPTTSTFTFAQSSYTSSYIDFVPVETSDRQQQQLQTLTASQQQLVTTYDGPPYNSSSGSIPFVNVGNKFLNYGPAFDPGLFRTNPKDTNSTALTHKEIANQLATGDDLSKAILGTANYITAAICLSTNNQPANVCTTSAIQQIQTTLSKLAMNSGGTTQGTAIASLDVVVRKRGFLA